MKCSLGICNFLEEIFSVSHSVVSLYFFALIAEEGSLISSCYSLELCIQCLYLSFSPLLFTSLLFTAICKASPESHFAFCISFPRGWSWSLSPVQCHEPHSIVHQALYCWEPPQAIPPMTRSCGRKLLSKASELNRLPRLSWASTPQTRICLFYYFMTFTNSSDINRGLFLTTFLWRKLT